MPGSSCTRQARVAHRLLLSDVCSSCATRSAGGQDWIGAELGLAPRTVSAILRRHHVPYLRECDPLTGEVIRASKTTAVRYEHPYPGSLVHMDVKKIGKIPDGGGWKLTAARWAEPALRSGQRSGLTTCTHSSTTTAGSPTPRYSPDERGRPAQHSYSGSPPTSPASESRALSAS